jgi:2-oxoglutarate dehydrogenase E2 component (dihydrolipoamide succinyltransferase)
MSIEIKVPALPESVADATVVTWHKKTGDAVVRDELLVEIETDKVVLEVPAPADGVLGEVLADEGAVVTAADILGTISEGEAASGSAPAKDDKTDKEEKSGSETSEKTESAQTEEESQSEPQTSPAVRKLLAENDLDARQISGTGKNGRILKEDVLAYLESSKNKPGTEEKKPAEPAPPEPTPAVEVADGERPEKRVPMTRIRARISQRLLEATQTTAMLTTFNEVNMKPFIDFRNQYKDSFLKQHGIKLGFMSIFVKAAAEALRRFPDINASIDGNDIVYHGFCDIGVAVSTDDGLVVPILRDAEHMSIADIEKNVSDYAEKARSKKLSLEEMTGGTFTITNGGVFGSMMSTPILNPPQSAILGMHATQERAVVIDGEIVIRPMMYIALSYDHRIVDGKGAVSFLKTIKEFVEDPARMLFDV